MKVFAPALAAFDNYRETVGLDDEAIEVYERQQESAARRRRPKEGEAEHLARVAALRPA
jgi:tRNA A58 N-methylase Trm61